MTLVSIAINIRRPLYDRPFHIFQRNGRSIVLQDAVRLAQRSHWKDERPIFPEKVPYLIPRLQPSASLTAFGSVVCPFAEIFDSCIFYLPSTFAPAGSVKSQPARTPNHSKSITAMLSLTLPRLSPCLVGVPQYPIPALSGNPQRRRCQPRFPETAPFKLG